MPRSRDLALSSNRRSSRCVSRCRTLSDNSDKERPPVERRGLLLVLSSPSGAGKTTMASRLLASDSSIALSVSLTTRAPRANEIDGQDYFFVDEAEFQARRQAGDLLEWARVFNHFYGTPKAPVEAALAAGQDLLFDIDWQGAQQIAESMAQDLVRVFVLPPSGPVLEERLRARAQDSDQVVADRMSRAADEISHWAEYDYVIVNDDLEASSLALQSILIAERHNRERQRGLPRFVRRVMSSL
ncbi:MAG: guanylate kinase [Hyphomicrobiaceae bacterium]